MFLLLYHEMPFNNNLQTVHRNFISASLVIGYFPLKRFFEIALILVTITMLKI